MKLFKKIVSTVLAVSMLLTPKFQVETNAASSAPNYIDNAGGNVQATYGKSSNSSWNDSKQGIRIYAVDPSGAQVGTGIDVLYGNKEPNVLPFAATKLGGSVNNAVYGKWSDILPNCPTPITSGAAVGESVKDWFMTEVGGEVSSNMLSVFIDNPANYLGVTIADGSAFVTEYLYNIGAHIYMEPILWFVPAATKNSAAETYEGADASLFVYGTVTNHGYFRQDQGWQETLGTLKDPNATKGTDSAYAYRHWTFDPMDILCNGFEIKDPVTRGSKSVAVPVVRGKSGGYGTWWDTWVADVGSGHAFHEYLIGEKVPGGGTSTRIDIPDDSYIYPPPTPHEPPDPPPEHGSDYSLYTIVKTYHTILEDGSIDHEVTYYRHEVPPTIDIEEEVHLDGWKLTEWFSTTTYHDTYAQDLEWATIRPGYGPEVQQGGGEEVTVVLNGGIFPEATDTGYEKVLHVLYIKTSDSSTSTRDDPEGGGDPSVPQGPPNPKDPEPYHSGDDEAVWTYTIVKTYHYVDEDGNFTKHEETFYRHDVPSMIFVEEEVDHNQFKLTEWLTTRDYQSSYASGLTWEEIKTSYGPGDQSQDPANEGFVKLNTAGETDNYERVLHILYIRPEDEPPPEDEPDPAVIKITESEIQILAHVHATLDIGSFNSVVSGWSNPMSIKFAFEDLHHLCTFEGCGADYILSQYEVQDPSPTKDDIDETTTIDSLLSISSDPGENGDAIDFNVEGVPSGTAQSSGLVVESGPDVYLPHVYEDNNPVVAGVAATPVEINPVFMRENLVDADPLDAQYLSVFGFDYRFALQRGAEDPVTVPTASYSAATIGGGDRSSPNTDRDANLTSLGLASGDSTSAPTARAENTGTTPVEYDLLINLDENTENENYMVTQSICPNYAEHINDVIEAMKAKAEAEAQNEEIARENAAAADEASASFDRLSDDAQQAALDDYYAAQSALSGDALTTWLANNPRPGTINATPEVPVPEVPELPEFITSTSSQYETLEYEAQVLRYTYGGVPHEVGNAKPAVLGYGMEVMGDGGKISFYPYLQMSYEEGVAEADAESFDIPTGNGEKKLHGVLSTHISEIELIKRAYAALVSNPTVAGGLELVSQQWSTHVRAIEAAWGSYSNVLPGGAIYMLGTGEKTSHYIDMQMTVPFIEGELAGATIVIVEGDAEIGNPDLTVEGTEEAINNMTEQLVTALDTWQVDLYAGDIAGSDGGLNNNVRLTGIAQELWGDYDVGRGFKTEDKYKLFMDGETGSAYSGESNEGDMDVHAVINLDIYYRVRADINGDIYFASAQSPLYGTDIYDVAGHAMTTVSYPSDAEVTALLNANETKVLSKAGTAMQLTGTAAAFNATTGLITNLLTVITRNEGDDMHATDWAADGKWYNEAVDGICYVNYHREVYFGYEHTSVRSSILNPAIIPVSENKGDILTLARAGAFATSSSSIAYASETDGFLCAGFGLLGGGYDLYTDGTAMYYSKVFAIPNANVQDLS